MQTVNGEVKSLYEFCRQSGFSDDEIEEICRPLRQLVQKDRIKKWCIIFGGFLLLFVAFHFLKDSETLQWHTSAFGRILMIKFLPFWDWTMLFDKRCLFDKTQPTYESKITNIFTDCDQCESVASIPISRILKTTYDEILNQYLIKSLPVVVTDANVDWISKKTPKENLTKVILDDERLRDSNPCTFKTNLRLGQPADLNNFFNKITDYQISNWFFHIQNCDLQAVKSLRTIVPRPYFLSPHIPPAHLNWLLMSNEYSSKGFKSLALDSGLVVLSQLKGTTYIQITPIHSCESLCPTLTVNVQEDETLVLENSLWNLEYMPDKNELNIAVLTETAWNDI